MIEAPPATALEETNRRFYDRLWADSHLVEPERFNTWPLVSRLLPAAPRRLEVAPGLRPRLPLAGTCFVDISVPAMAKLRARGAQTATGAIIKLPCADAAFDLVCALDIVEHVEDDEGAFAELARVTAPGGRLMLSVPLHAALWTDFDVFVGHRRRYEPARLLELLNRHGFTAERSAAFGMKPKSPRLVAFGVWHLRHFRRFAMWWYNLFLPLNVRFQKPLADAPGLLPCEDVAEIFLLCRRDAQPR